jgi:hypothetical protein
MAEGGVGIPGGTEHPFRHGDRQPRKTKFGFLRRKPISFGKSWVKSRKGSKN